MEDCATSDGSCRGSATPCSTRGSGVRRNPASQPPRLARGSAPPFLDALSGVYQPCFMLCYPSAWRFVISRCSR
ncbi:hypothetical protein PENSPDRAFT_69104 [Peniophora sp. CONT]|nr:hypothetical protein PENSPDRAFT_69104 [Peniophora sp. CONT]